MVFSKPREPTPIFNFLVKDRLGLRKSLKSANPRGRVLETKTESKVNGQPRPRGESERRRASQDIYQKSLASKEALEGTGLGF